jgi:hypothetical protein
MRFFNGINDLICSHAVNEDGGAIFLIGLPITVPPIGIMNVGSGSRKGGCWLILGSDSGLRRSLGTPIGKVSIAIVALPQLIRGSRCQRHGSLHQCQGGQGQCGDCHCHYLIVTSQKQERARRGPFYLPPFLILRARVRSRFSFLGPRNDFSSAYEKNAYRGIFLVCTVIHVCIQVCIQVPREELVILYGDKYPLDKVNSDAHDIQAHSGFFMRNLACLLQVVIKLYVHTKESYLYGIF